MAAGVFVTKPTRLLLRRDKFLEREESFTPPTNSGATTVSAATFNK